VATAQPTPNVTPQGSGVRRPLPLAGRRDCDRAYASPMRAQALADIQPAAMGVLTNAGNLS
jgi:hypothetical protein